jgi:hypothetical protein
LAISDQGVLSSKKNEEQKIRHREIQGDGGGFFKGTIPNVKIDPVATQATKQKMDIAQTNKNIGKMHNEIIRLSRNEDSMPDSTI